MTWENSGSPPFLDWPPVPGFEDGATRILYHMCNLHAGQVATLEARGWKPIDIRLMPDDDDDAERERIKAFLTGVMLGSIEADSSLYRFVEAGMKVFGMHKGNAGSGDKAPQVDDDDIETLLNLRGSSPAALSQS